MIGGSPLRAGPLFLPSNVLLFLNTITFSDRRGRVVTECYPIDFLRRWKLNSVAMLFSGTDSRAREYCMFQDLRQDQVDWLWEAERLLKVSGG